MWHLCEGVSNGCDHDGYFSSSSISIAPPRRGPQCGHSDVPTCNDQKACTIDFCREPNGCGHTAVNCDDGDLCTVDACAEPAGCSHTPRDCDDGDACTADDCLPGSGCRHVPINPCCESAADCPDVVCAVERQCVANGCTAGVPRACDDGDAATVDSCDAGQGGCVHVRLPDDGGPGSCVDAPIAICKSLKAWRGSFIAKSRVSKYASIAVPLSSLMIVSISYT